ALPAQCRDHPGAGNVPGEPGRRGDQRDLSALQLPAGPGRAGGADREGAVSTQLAYATAYEQPAVADAVIRISALRKEYVLGVETVRALRGVDMQIERGDYVAIMGPSGSGKSTLMNVIGCLDTPTSGEYWLNGQAVSELDDDQLAHI